MEPYRIFIGVLVGFIPLMLLNSVSSVIDCDSFTNIAIKNSCIGKKNMLWFFSLPMSGMMMFVALRGLRTEQSWYEFPCGKCGKKISKGTTPCPKCGEILFWLPKRVDNTPHPDYWLGMKEKERIENEIILQRYDAMPFLEKKN